MTSFKLNSAKPIRSSTALSLRDCIFESGGGAAGIEADDGCAFPPAIWLSPDDRPTCTSMSSVPKPDLAPEAEIVEEHEEQSLPLPEEQAAKLRFDEDQGSLAAGAAA